MTEPGPADLTETAPVLENDHKTSLLMLIATFAGVWLLIEQLAGFDNIWDVLKTADWLWVLLALFFSQSMLLTEAISLSAPLPLRCGSGPWPSCAPPRILQAWWVAPLGGPRRSSGSTNGTDSHRRWP